jgi:hypothetical protein
MGQTKNFLLIPNMLEMGSQTMQILRFSDFVPFPYVFAYIFFRNIVWVHFNEFGGISKF